MSSLKQAENLAQTLAHRVSAVVAEREALRRELTRSNKNILERGKAYVEAYRHAVCARAYAELTACRLERMLAVR